MRKRYLVNLTEDEPAALTQLVKLDRVSGLKRLRASILLKADEGLTDQEIADDLDAGLVTVERVRKRCCERGLQAMDNLNIHDLSCLYEAFEPEEPHCCHEPFGV